MFLSHVINHLPEQPNKYITSVARIQLCWYDKSTISAHHEDPHNTTKISIRPHHQT